MAIDAIGHAGLSQNQPVRRALKMAHSNGLWPRRHLEHALQLLQVRSGSRSVGVHAAARTVSEHIGRDGAQIAHKAHRKAHKAAVPQQQRSLFARSLLAALLLRVLTLRCRVPLHTRQRASKQASATQAIAAAAAALLFTLFAARQRASYTKTTAM